MMYKNTPSQKASEAFLTYYYQNMKTLWTKKTGIGLPPLKSIATAAYANDPISTKIINEWQPISKTWGAPGSNTVFLGVTKVDGTQPRIDFTQAVLGGKTTAKAALDDAAERARRPHDPVGSCLWTRHLRRSPDGGRHGCRPA